MSLTIGNLVARPRHDSDDEFILRLSERIFAPYSLRPRSAMAAMLAEDGVLTMIAEAAEDEASHPGMPPSDRRTGFFVIACRRLGKSFGPWADPATAHLNAIGVTAEVRGRGVGRFLLASAEAAARARGAVCLTLMTAETNARARKVFAAGGFLTLLGVDRAYAKGQRGIAMLKPLRAPEPAGDLRPP